MANFIRNTQVMQGQRVYDPAGISVAGYGVDLHRIDAES